MSSKGRSGRLAVAVCLILVLSPASAQSTEQRREQSQLEQISTAFQALAKRVSPTVVKVLAIGYRPLDDEEDPNSLTTRQQSSGSGVIVDPNGYIITNAHVILGAERVQVLLPAMDEENPKKGSIIRPQGRRLRADIVGIDLETDLAVLKVPAKNLPALELGDSETVEQGQLVLALGSPLGLENSVSMGVVSAKARQLRADDTMIYIQTDAPINPGSSGGPLIDTQGRVIGINTLLLTQSGVNEGIGFAAPSNIVRTVYEQIRRNGRVIRGDIGADAQTIDPTLAKGWKLARDSGVVISDVEPEGPAATAGLRVGDIILTLNGKPMENARQFAVNLYRPKIGETVRLEVLRGQQKLTFNVPVAEKLNDPERFAALVTGGENLVPQLGILVVELTPRILERLTPLRKGLGVLVVARTADAPVIEGGGFRAGDIIYAINREVVASLADVRLILSRYKSGDAIAVQLERNGKLMFVSFELP
ncbi:MAG: trypsin-like peptidase domain-containing protein [Bryobacteraceae bacterium]|nr:trypsin-like peptidase domain-containing protein [Bryobacteraceae bacterium]